METLRNRASKEFAKHMDKFQNTGQLIGLPASRLTPNEWQQLNAELAKDGICLIQRQLNNRPYYVFTTPLRNNVSHHFEKYLDEFLQTGQSAGFPTSRLNDQEWEQLNTELATIGIKMEKRQHSTNDGIYYWFTRTSKKANNTDKYNSARQDIINMLFDQIKAKYPNISNPTILEIINTRGDDVDAIYDKLRYKQDGNYTDVSEQEYNAASQYALEHCNNTTQNNLIPKTWEQLGRHIKMRTSKDGSWWFRSCDGNTVPPVTGNRKSAAFHISLNVNIYDKTLKALDDILIADGGRYIHSYKFPTINYYDLEILTRHDPITIYMHARNPELEQKIVAAIKPFVRSNEGLIDEILGPGVCISPETSNNKGPSVGTKAANDIANMIAKYRDRL